MQITKWLQQIVAGGRLIFNLSGAQFQATAYIGTWATLADAATITPVLTTANKFVLTCANNNARAIKPPANPVSGDSIEIKIINTSGGVLNATTFDAAIKQPAVVTYPANGYNRTYRMEYQGTSWFLVSISSADCAN